MCPHIFPIFSYFPAQDPFNPQTLNRYSYALNNPLLYIDPTGHFFGIDDIIIGAIIGAIIGGTVAAITGGNIWQGIAMGAITGGFMGGVSGIISAADAACASLSSVTEAGLYAAAGGMAGAINASIYGMDVGRGALFGGLFGLAGYALPNPNFGLFGNSATNEVASIANRIFDSAVTGSAFGAAYAGMSGGDVWQGAMIGAMAWGIGEAANMGIGHAVGLIGSGFKKPEFIDGAFVYYTNSESAITFSNVITGGKDFLKSPVIINGKEDLLGRTNLQHEIAHIKQGTVLGPGYIAAHGASLTVGGIIGTFTGRGFMIGTHRYNVFERWWIDVPSYY